MENYGIAKYSFKKKHITAYEKEDISGSFKKRHIRTFIKEAISKLFKKRHINKSFEVE